MAYKDQWNLASDDEFKRRMELTDITEKSRDRFWGDIWSVAGVGALGLALMLATLDSLLEGPRSPRSGAVYPDYVFRWYYALAAGLILLVFMGIGTALRRNHKLTRWAYISSLIYAFSSFIWLKVIMIRCAVD